MVKEAAEVLAESDRGLIVSPAGCGKTRLIAKAVSQNEGRQLIPTHTHAGVRAMLNHLRQLGVPSNRYRVSTIDGWALRYANAFPGLSNWNNKEPTGDAWQELCPAATLALKHKAVRRVLASSYDGVYVDEYQDCSAGQHELISLITNIRPCRVVGDPMQAVFWNINKGRNISWSDVQSTFPKIAELSTPWRWRHKNENLGRWLLQIRQLLTLGNPVDLRKGPIKWVPCSNHATQLRVCFDVLKDFDSTVVAIRQWARQCHYLARYLKNTFASMETVECEDLLTWAQRIEENCGIKRVGVFVEFVNACISKLPSAVGKVAESVLQGKLLQPRRLDFQRIVSKLIEISQSESLQPVGHAMDAIEQVNEKIVYARRELWREMRKTLREYDPKECTCLMDKAWRIRDIGRRIGRHVDKRCLSTTLLVKGLEFDHAVILDAGDLKDAENLYVAMTRGSKSLTVLSENPIIQYSRPHYMI